MEVGWKSLSLATMCFSHAEACRGKDTALTFIFLTHSRPASNRRKKCQAGGSKGISSSLCVHTLSLFLDILAFYYFFSHPSHQYTRQQWLGSDKSCGIDELVILAVEAVNLKKGKKEWKKFQVWFHFCQLDIYECSNLSYCLWTSAVS